MQSLAIFPLFYLPPVSYFSALERHGFEFLLEKYEHFPKQTYRNRARIYSPNGILDLIVPVLKGSNVHTKMKDVRISYDFRWQRVHWMSLQTCYRSSAYFEYYEDELAVFYHKKFEYLFDYNLELLDWLLKQLKKKLQLGFTQEYTEGQELSLDYRTAFSVKKDVSSLGSKEPYYQVFEDRHGFLPNLSVVDLLFNQGPQAKNYI
jgi:hypothetical protein